MISQRRWLASFWLVATASCTSQQKTPPASPELSSAVIAEPKNDATALAKIEIRATLSHPSALGISGACQRGSDLFLVGERNHTLLQRSASGSLRALPITGVPEGLDLEGLACSENSLYISTESEVFGRSSDLVLKVQVRGQEAVVTKQIEMHYPPGVVAGDNHGLEGLCIAGEWLIASGEIIRESHEGKRQAPILQRKLSGGETLVSWVNLTSKTGKLSGIDCHLANDNAIDVFAIERHFNVARVLRFQVGSEAKTGQEVLELESILQESENFEAIIVAPNGEIRLYNDNQYKTVTGPSEEVRLAPLHTFAI